MSESILTHFEEIKSRGLSIDITRGKPDAFQLDLANDLLKICLLYTSDAADE